MKIVSSLLLLSSLATGFKVLQSPADWFNSRLRREVVDLHNGEFCVDVSTFGAVSFEKIPREKCLSTMQKACETKNQQVCDEVTEIQCEIVPFTECEMQMEPVAMKTFRMVSKVFKKKVCKEGSDIVQHTKMMPDCKNVTKQNCVTKWETDASGNQVWAGNEDCEPVTWRECQLVPRQVDFKVPKIECEDSDEIPYMDFEEAEDEQMTSKMVCSVKHSANCKPVTSTKCQNIAYQECQEQPQEKCEKQDMMIPKQEKDHKKKCLLPDDAPGIPVKARGGNNNVDAEKLADAVAATNDEALEESESRQYKQVVQQPRSSKQGRIFQGQVGAARHVDAGTRTVPLQHQQQQPLG